MIRLRRAHIRRFRGLAPDTRLELGPDEVFLLGLNGTGKSTLLGLLSALVHLDLKGLVEPDPGVDVSWELEGEGLELKATLTVEPSEGRHEHRGPPRPPVFAGGANGAGVGRWSVDVEVVGIDPELRSDRPRLTLSLGSDREAQVHPPISDEVVQALARKDLAQHDLIYLVLEGLRDAMDANRWAQAPGTGPFMDRVTRFLSKLLPRAEVRSAPVLDEALLRFGSVVDSARVRSWSASSPEGLVLRFGFGDFTPEPIAQHVAEVGGASPAQAELRANKGIAAALGATSVLFVPRLASQDAVGDQTWQGFDVLVTWPDGSRHRHHKLSFGQKRLIAHHWVAALEPELPYFADELTNGLHAGWVRQIADQLQGRQSFHALQNPLLLDFMGPGEVDAIPGRFVLCGVELVEGRRVWTWRNPTADEAREVRASWDAGFQSLSVVLRSLGLW